MKDIVKRINFKYFYFLLILLPITQLVSFLLSTSGDVPLDYRAYPSLLIFIFFVYVNRKSIYVWLVVMIFVFYTVFFQNATLSGRAGYMLDFSLACIILYTLPNIRFKKIKLKTIDKGIILLCYGIIISYLLTLRVNAHPDDERVYMVGYIIPHAFSYLMAIFTYYFLVRKKYIFSIAPFLLGAFAGTRTGFILCILSVLSVSSKLVTKENIYKILIFGLIFIISVVFVSSKFSVFKGQIDSVFNSISGFDFSLSKNNQESIDYTSNRSLLLATGLDQMINDGISNDNIFGRGPRSSYDFFENKFDWKLWFHNDFMDILFSLGVINLIIYIIAITRYYKKTKSKYFLIFVVFSAFTNGFFFYSSFVIVCIHYTSLYLNNYENTTDKQLPLY